jgi:hypothetical protein
MMNPYSPHRRVGKHGWNSSVQGISSELECSLSTGQTDLPHLDPVYDPDPGSMNSRGPEYQVPYEGISRYDSPEIQDTPALPPIRVEPPFELMGELKEVISDLHALGQMLERDPRLGKDPSLWPSGHEVMEMFREAAEEVAQMDLVPPAESEALTPQPMEPIPEDPLMGIEKIVVEPEPESGLLEQEVQQAYAEIRSPLPDPMAEEEEEWRRQMESQQMVDPFMPPGP